MSESLGAMQFEGDLEAQRTLGQVTDDRTGDLAQRPAQKIITSLHHGTPMRLCRPHTRFER